MITLFHKPAWKPNNKQQHFTLFVEKYTVTEEETNVLVYFKAVWRKLIAIENTFIIPKPKDYTQDTVYELWYNAKKGICRLKDFLTVSPFIAKEDVDEVCLGRIHFEEHDNVLLYLAGRFEDLPNVENVILTEDTQSSLHAMTQHSKRINAVLEKIALKKTLARDVDYVNSISCLEAQLDIATRIIMYLAEQQGLQNTQLYQMLQLANNNSVFSTKGPEQVLDDLQYKKCLREKQAELL